jgi:ComF family protein
MKPLFKTSRLKGAFEDFFSLIFPDKCESCNANLMTGEQIICTSCQLHLPKTDHIIIQENTLRNRFQGRTNFQYAMSYLKYNKHGRVQKLIRSLKYHGKKEIGIQLGVQMSHLMKEHGFFHTFDSIIPVPLHGKREKLRGYNQASMFAEGLSKNLAAAIDSQSVIRKKFTKSQTKFSGTARWNNVQDIFLVTKPENIAQKHILIVDDVVTTGATVESLANEILIHKPLSVSLVCISYASKN